jgi:hypothetical protein
MFVHNDQEMSLTSAQRRQTMLTNSKIALSVALVLATASAAVAAPKHAIRHRNPIERQVSANDWLSFSSERPANSANEPTYMKIQDIDAATNDRVTQSNEATVGQRQPTIFRVQPTLESVRVGLELKGPPTLTELSLKNVIERSARDFAKVIICRGC